MIQLSDNISNYITKHFGNEYLQKYTEYFHGGYLPYLRISPFVDETLIIKRLKEYKIELERIENIDRAYRITEGQNIAGKTLEFILGKYYIQSLSSMISALVLNPSEKDIVLDLCAAPGSKTTQLAELMNNKGTLVANEISLDRTKSLVFNIDKMNLVNVGIMNYNGELLSKIFNNYFDKVLVDAPCSALGITQKRGEVSNWWNEKKATGLAEIQFKLLVSAIKSCRVGGEIVYSTCTLSLEENELVLNKILKKYPVELVDIKLPVKSVNAFTKFGNEELNETISKAKRILPWEINSEGFFVSKLIKTGDVDPSEKYPRKEKKYEILSSKSGKMKNIIAELSDFFGIPPGKFDEYKYIIKNEDIYFVDAAWDYENIDAFIRVGSKLGAVDKKKIFQLHTLAAQSFGAFAKYNIEEISERNELQTYFEGRIIKRNIEKPGQKIIKYKDYFLGTAGASKEGLKSQFPRAFRTQEIILPS